MGEQINVRNEGGIKIIEFNNPPFNFITNVMLKELHSELVDFKNHRSQKVLVLTGGMKDSFITHYDVSELISFNEAGDQTGGRPWAAKLLYKFVRRMNNSPRLEKRIMRSMENRSPAEQGIFYWSRCMELLDTMPKPIIAAINGMSMGGGCEISLCCDFRYMARHPHYRIGLPEVLVGIIPGGTGTPQRLPLIVGEGRALEILLTGSLYTPDQAESMGLINQAIEPDELMPFVMDLAGRLSRYAPIAMASVKKSVREAARLSYHEGRALDLHSTNKAMFSKDANKGMRWYVEDQIARYPGLEPDKFIEDFNRITANHPVDFEGN